MGDYIGCNLTKKELVFYELGQRSYTIAGQIGDLLIDFLSLDFETIEAIRKECLEKMKSDREAKNKGDNINYENSAGCEMLTKLEDKKIKHPYFNLPISHLSTVLNEENVPEYDLTGMVSSLRHALDFCCNLDYDQKLNKLTTIQRYYLYLETYDSPLFSSYSHNLKTHFTLNDSAFIDKLQGLLYDENYDLIINTTSDEFINFLKEQIIVPGFLFAAETVFDYIFFEFIKMIELNVQIKICKNCGKYFILKGDYATDYCDRIPGKEKFTCKRIAAKKARKEKLISNPVLREYEKAYKRKYAQVSNKRLDHEAFRLWVDEATIKRDKAAELYSQNPDDQIIQKFKKYLGNK